MKQETLDAVQRHCKKAEGFTDAVQSAHGGLLRQQAMQQLGRLLLTGAGVGMGARGLMGLMQLTKRNLRPPKALGSGVIPVEIPLPVEEEEQPLKTAGAVSNFFSGDFAKNPAGIPWMIPATVLGGGGALYGGWKLMDAVLDARRRAELDAEVEDAKTNFQQALLSEFERPVKVPKLAANDSLRRDLERLYHHVKRAGMLEDTLHGAGIGAGVYGTMAGVSGLAAAIAAYQATRKRQEQELLRKAHKLRQRQRWSQQPPPLVASPVPIPQAPAAPSAMEEATL